MQLRMNALIDKYGPLAITCQTKAGNIRRRSRKHFNSNRYIYIPSVSDILYLYINSKKRCYYCNKRLSRTTFTIEHVVPLAICGGGGGVNNLEISCLECNQIANTTWQKGNKMRGKTVYSNRRVIQAPAIDLHPLLRPNERLKMDGLDFLSLLPPASIPVAFLDPQYRGVLDKLSYGNEGQNRGKRRSALMQMDEQKIAHFVQGIDRVLIPSGHLFLWMDKFHLCEEFKSWLDGTRLDVVDLIVWDKEKLGMGYRSRRVSEYCVVLQKRPRRAKGVWKIHNIRDVWREQASSKVHPHQKPINLQAELIAAVSDEGDYVIDPAAGSFSVMEAANAQNRNFIGCDLEG